GGGGGGSGPEPWFAARAGRAGPGRRGPRRAGGGGALPHLPPGRESPRGRRVERRVTALAGPRVPSGSAGGLTRSRAGTPGRRSRPTGLSREAGAGPPGGGAPHSARAPPSPAPTRQARAPTPPPPP